MPAIVKLVMSIKPPHVVPSGGRMVYPLQRWRQRRGGDKFDKMNQIGQFYEADSMVGDLVSSLNHYKYQKSGLYYAVDFASSGSSQIGGNISTNAGGIRLASVMV